MAEVINLQVASFAGLGLPRTFNRPVKSSATVGDAFNEIFKSLPSDRLRDTLILTTIDGHRLLPDNNNEISSIANGASILPLRLSARLCGGKGGFGSQLRAAGGRMSSRKNRDRENANGSNRNLDGRRLRTVDEANKLAQYLQTKPEMDRQEKEEKRKRWEAVIKAADETEEKIKNGRMGSNQGRLNADYVESKELAEERMREAITRAAKDGILVEEKTGSESPDMDVGGSDDQHDSGSSSTSSNVQEASSSNPRQPTTAFFGWDEEDNDDEEDMDDNDETDEIKDAKQELEASQQQLQQELEDDAYSGKGKSKVV